MENRLSRPEILVVAKLWPAYMDMLREAFIVHDRSHVEDPAQFAGLAARIRGIAASGEAKVPESLIQQLPALEIISVFGVGYDGVDVAVARAHGVPVTNTPDVLTDDVADLGVALMLSIARRIPQADKFVRAGLWPNGPFPLARKVSGARLGIVGLGRIGQAIAQRAEPFGMSIAYTTRNKKPGCQYAYYPDAEALAHAVDFLIVITPGGAATRGLIDAKVLAALGPKGYLINVARGSVVDQPALVHAVTTGLIAGAALDVFADEPQVPAELRAHENVVLTPHMASGTWETRRAMANLALDNLRAHFAGRPLLTPVP
ncbi:MAG: 2-hydroxyacid dehydrogenase [Rhodoferax sp.]|nr:2-hydroxyacid dehydrogenase [Rhodoferax sp.]